MREGLLLDGFQSTERIVKGDAAFAPGLPSIGNHFPRAVDFCLQNVRFCLSFNIVFIIFYGVYFCIAISYLNVYINGKMGYKI